MNIPSHQNTLDFYYMRRALRLARKAEGHTSPNPMVGAILVKDSKIIAQGYHKRAGLPHAEIVAIKKAHRNTKGATLYVNLEPCCHFGRTPPCVDQILELGLRRVVVATKDPNPVVAGRSLKKLRAAGVKITYGILESAAQRLNEVFFKNMRTRLPFVVAKVAQSLDGKIATRQGESKWITGPRARQYARRLRDKYDSVLVGVTTIIKDNPHLNGRRKVPYKVIIDPRLEIPNNSNILKENPERVLLFTSNSQRHKKKRVFEHARVFFVSEHRGGLSLQEVLRKLYILGVTSVFVEGGSFTLGSFHQARLIDKVHIFVAPKIIGGSLALSSFGAKGFQRIDDAACVRDVSITHIGQDLLVTGYPCYA